MRLAMLPLCYFVGLLAMFFGIIGAYKDAQIAVGIAIAFAIASRGAKRDQ